MSNVIKINGYDVRDFNSVHYNTSDGMTDEQKAQARRNIGAASAGDVADLKDEISAVDLSKINKPVQDGTNGQVLLTNGNGTTRWVDYGLPTDEQTANAVGAWLEDHPEATTTVEDGSITEAKLAASLDDTINQAQYVLDLRASFFKASTGHSSHSVEGCCYDSSRERIVMAMYSGADGYLLAYNKAFELVKDVAVANIGHANDLAYDPNRDKIYIATGSEVPNTIMVIDPATLTAVKTVTLPSFNAWNIAYDADSDVIYVGDLTNWYKTDATFSAFEPFGTYAAEDIGAIIGASNVAPQGSVVINGYLHCFYTSYADGKSRGYVVKYTAAGAVDTVTNTCIDYELESGFLINDALYLVYGQQYISFYSTQTRKTNGSAIVLTNPFTNGAIIPANADLDDYTQIGRYMSSSSANTLTLSHLPYTKIGPFTLQVSREAFGLIQEISNNTNCVFRRTYVVSDNAWGEWRQVLTIPMEYSISAAKVITGGYVTTGAKLVTFSIPFYNLKNETFGSSTAFSAVKITSLKVSARQNGSYIIGSGTPAELIGDSTYKIDTVLNELTLNISVRYADGSTTFPNATNNDAVGIEATISFTVSRPA